MAVPLRHFRFPLLFAAALLLQLTECHVSEPRDDAYPYFPVPPEVHHTQTGSSESCPPTGCDVGEEVEGGEDDPILTRKRLLFLDPDLMVPRRRSPGGAHAAVVDAAKARFTPWGGKRSAGFVAVETDRKFHPWSGKRGRNENGRQFHPWGGKRNSLRSEGVEED